MPVLLGNPPAIRTPGAGPNGPGPIDARKRVTSVGENSSVPYGPTLGYATDGGVTGFIGPAAGSIRQPTSWYVRATGSNNNGGSSSGTSADRTGTDGSTTSGSLTFTSASGAFTPADIGKGICIQNATFCYAKITAINSGTSVQLSNPPSATVGSLSWSIGGAWADPRPVLHCSAFANTSCGVQSGDTVYVGAGTYRQVYSLGSNFGRSWQATGTLVAFVNANFNGQANIVGDVDGSHTGDAGMVQLTGYTTNDKTVPSGTTLLNLNGKSNLAFSNILFIGGAATLLTASTAISQNITFQDCSMLAQISQALWSIQGVANTQFNWSMDRCFLGGIGTANGATSLPTSASADYAANMRWTNCLFFGPATKIAFQSSGALSHFGGGASVRNCAWLAQTTNGTFVTATTASLSTVFPILVYNNVIAGGSPSLNATTLGQVIEDYNLIYAVTPRTNVTAGAHSVSDSSYAALFHFGQERIWGALLRPFGEPMANSPLLGFGNDGAQTAYDGYNRPRPGGGLSALPAVGWLERGNTAAQATSPAPPSGTHDWQFTGPGYQDFLLPVSNSATTVAISVQRDSAYAPPPGGTNPAMLILANGNLGVTAQTIVDTGASGGWNTLTSAAFTPSGTGWVTVRIASYDGSGASVVSFAAVTVT